MVQERKFWRDAGRGSRRLTGVLFQERGGGGGRAESDEHVIFKVSTFLHVFNHD